MRWLEDFSNKIMDTDWAWFPYVSLRPEKNQEMDNKFVSKITLYYTPIFGAFYAFILVLFPNYQLAGFEPKILVYSIILVLFMFLFFIILRLTSAVAWNNRARRLNKTKHGHDAVRE